MVFVPDENLKHMVSTACRPGVFQIALFEGFPNLPHNPPTPTGHSAGTNQATMATTLENAPYWHDPHQPREIWDLRKRLRIKVQSGLVLNDPTNDAMDHVAAEAPGAHAICAHIV